jgi:hypothetical protein
MFLAAFPAVAARRRAVAPVIFPDCGSVTGSPAVTFSRDGGRTLVPTVEKLDGIAYTYGLAALDASTLLAAHNTTVSISTDAGCSWRAVGDVPFDYPPSITGTYIWAEARMSLARYANNAIKILKPPVAIVGLGVDRATPDRVRIGGDDGTLWESLDGGDSWMQLGTPAAPSAFAYRAAFDPANLDHVVFGFVSNAAGVTFNGGRTWTPSTGFARPSNVFNVVVSPADPNVVWAMGLNVAESDANVPSHGRHIYLSRDGGATFAPVVDAAPGVQLINGPLLAPHPTDPNVLYFVFGTYFDAYGTDLFRYDAAPRTLSLTHHAYDDFDAIVFSPADPNVMYFGLEVVRRVAP